MHRVNQRLRIIRVQSETCMKEQIQIGLENAEHFSTVEYLRKILHYGFNMICIIIHYFSK